MHYVNLHAGEGIDGISTSIRIVREMAIEKQKIGNVLTGVFLSQECELRLYLGDLCLDAVHIVFQILDVLQLAQPRAVGALPVSQDPLALASVIF